MLASENESLGSGEAPTVLDCTLRDGGYYNNWDFDLSLVESYLDAMDGSGVSYVELGLRRFPGSSYLGPFAYTTDLFLSMIDIPRSLKVAVMLDAKTVLQSDESVSMVIKQLFGDRSTSSVTLVRVAAHVNEISQCGEIVRALVDLGYEVGLNVMQAGYREQDELRAALNSFDAFDRLTVLYFADSLGNMDAAEVARLARIFREFFDGQLGIHTHENMGRGLSNTFAAVARGVVWLDATISGMGRGAGNTRTEELLSLLQGEYPEIFSADQVGRLAVSEFYPARERLGWGSNLFYFKSASAGVHPTFVQLLLADNKLSLEEKFVGLNRICAEPTRAKFREDVYARCVSSSEADRPVSGAESCLELFRDKDVLILARGATLQRHRQAVKLLLDCGKFCSIGLNQIELDCQLDFMVTSHNSRFSTVKEALVESKSKLIAPLSRFSDAEKGVFEKHDIIDIGFFVTDELMNQPNIISSPYDLTLAYLLGILSQSSLRNLYLIGFDGYPDSADARQREMINVINAYSPHLNTEMISLTPTTYPITESSIYALL